MGQAGKLHLSTNFQPMHPRVIIGPVPSRWLLLFRPACQRSVQKQLSFPRECFDRSVLCPHRCFSVQPKPCSCCIPNQAKVLSGDEVQSSWHELCLPPCGLQGRDPTRTEIRWHVQDLSCHPASTSHPRMSFVNPIALYWAGP